MSLLCILTAMGEGLVTEVWVLPPKVASESLQPSMEDGFPTVT